MSASQLTPTIVRDDISQRRDVSTNDIADTSCSNALYDFMYGPGGAATFAGLCEIAIFHPFDTAAKRLMSHRKSVVDSRSWSRTITNINRVLFGSLPVENKDVTTFHLRSTTLFQYIKHMYPGSVYAIAYKVSQRVVKFAGQPYVKEYLNKYHNTFFFKENNFLINNNPSISAEMIQRQQSKSKMLLEATAGSLVGVMEIVLLPFDRMKVMNQTNRAALQEKNIIHVIREDGITTLYAGATTTALRNLIGSFLLFGSTAFVKDYIFGLQDYRDATFAQNVISSTVGSCAGVLFTSPIDVVKTRIQSQKFLDAASGLNIFMSTIRDEGIGALYKGIIPKLVTTAPRLVFSYSMTQHFLKTLQSAA